MTPITDSAASSVVDQLFVPAKLLKDGEAILLAVKPSGWFVLLVSWPVLAIAAGVAIAGVALQWANIDYPIVLWICGVAAGLRLFLAMLQWLGRLYVLTNARVMTVRGLFRPIVWDCPLMKVRNVTLAAPSGERLLALGDLNFESEPACPPEAVWTHVPHPHQVLTVVRQAIGRAK